MPVTDHRAGADSSQFSTHWVKEANWGVVPAGPPTLNTARITSNTVTLNKTTQRSNEISAGRKIKNRILTSLQVGGDIGFELSLDGPGDGGHADFFDGALFGTHTTPVVVGAAQVNVTGTNQFDAAAGTPYSGFAVGQWINTAGFTNAANNGRHRVTAVVGGGASLTVDSTLVNETGSGDETVTSSAMLRDGTTAHSYVFENLYGGISTPQHVAFLGCMFSQLSMNFETDAIVTGSLSVLGKTMNDPSASSVGDGSPAAATTQDVTNTVTDVGFIREAGVTPTSFIRTLNLQLDNGLRVQRAIHGSADSVGIGLGDADVTGTLNAFFDDGALVTKFKNHTPTQLDWRVTGPGGRVLILTIPRARLSSFGAPVNGPNQDVEQQYAFEAEVDPTTNATLQMDYFTS